MYFVLIDIGRPDLLPQINRRPKERLALLMEQELDLPIPLAPEISQNGTEGASASEVDNLQQQSLQGEGSIGSSAGLAANSIPRALPDNTRAAAEHHAPYIILQVSQAAAGMYFKISSQGD